MDFLAKHVVEHHLTRWLGVGLVSEKRFSLLYVKDGFRVVERVRLVEKGRFVRINDWMVYSVGIILPWGRLTGKDLIFIDIAKVTVMDYEMV